MDNAAVTYLSFRWHMISNPFSFVQLERTLAFTDLAPGDRAVDIGCGNGLVSAWMAERFGLDLIAVERVASVAEVARTNAAKPRSQGAMTVVEQSAADYLANAGQHRLVSLFGASHIFADLRRPAEIMAALYRSVAPGGWLIWGDLFWKKPPTPRLTLAFAEDRLETLKGWVAAGESTGFSPRYVAVSDEAAWDEFIWRMNDSLESFVEENPTTPSAAEIRQRTSFIRDAWLEEGRDGAGFALYLFKRPLAGAGADS